MSGHGARATDVQRGSLFALAGISALALAVRLLGFEDVFVGGDDVVFVIGDPWYHLRLSLYAFTHFPGFLTWDPYLHHPLGAFVPWPPLFDLLLAGSARLVGASQHGLEVGAALWPPALGALTVLPVFALARSVGGVRPALGAAALFAMLPASVVVTRVGYTDHHALVALLGATLLALQAGALAAPAGGVALGAALALARAALVATWQGSLAYLGIAEVSLVLVAAAVGARRVLAVETASLLASAALVAPLAPASARSVGGLFSTIELSWLHVAACVALAVFAGTSAAWAALARSAATRAARALACGALAAGALVAIPGVLQGRARAAEFLGKTDVWGTANPEQQPLFLFSGGTTWAEVLFGYLGYLVPVLPVYLAWRARREARSAPLLLLACWTASFGALAILQTRFANDLAPGASVGFALLLGEAGAWLARRLHVPGRAGAVAVGLGAALVALPLAREHGPPLRDTLAHLGGAGAGSDRALRSPGGTLLRFARTVRAATPETSGFLDANARPEYGILSDPSLGHVLHYVARRATPSDNFGAYFPQGLMATLRVLLALPEEPALATLRELQVRYVVTSWQPAYRSDSLLYQLHELDGLESGGHRALSRFRLVAEGPAAGVPLGAILAGADASRLLPYKLFEVVEGALLEIELEPGARAAASAEVITASGRHFRYSARGVADASGTARIRVPYASEGPPGPARTRTAWRIKVGGRLRCVEVSEQAVRSGAVVRVAPSAGCP